MASSIESDLLVLVRSLSGVTAYVGTGANARVYWTEIPEGTTQTYPYIVYSTVSVNGTILYFDKRTADALVQFSVFHNHLQNGLDCANALFDGLSGYHGTPSAKVVYTVACMGPRVIKDPAYDNVYQYVIDAEVRYER